MVSLGLNLYEGWKLAQRRGQEGQGSSSGGVSVGVTFSTANGISKGGIAEHAKTYLSRQETSDSLWQTQLQSLSNTKPDLRLPSTEIVTTTPHQP